MIDERRASVARGLMQPTSLAVICAFAALGAALPYAFEKHATASSPAAGVHALARSAEPSTVGGTPTTPRAVDPPQQVSDVVRTTTAVEPSTGTSSTAPTVAAPHEVATTPPKQSAPAAPAPPAPAPSPAPSLLNVHAPTPAGTVSVSVNESSVSATAPVVGTVALP